ncbi:hypothetical protein [Alloscardovia omnicolens]|uniref:hypothetical protein n=1 Tax=Alloscardovia omnicolens TaxID=419015 RepID=UPI0028EFA40C|nr:hypothetical protein [Alloscardovia omnicolens]
MSNKVEFRRVNDISKYFSAFIQMKLAETNHSIKDVERWLDRSYAHAYNRIKGVQSPTLDEVDIISRHVGYNSIFQFLDDLYDYIYPPVEQKASSARFSVTDFKEETIYDINDDTTPNTSEIQLAAHHDKNKKQEHDLDNYGA